MHPRRLIPAVLTIVALAAGITACSSGGSSAATKPGAGTSPTMSPARGVGAHPAGPAAALSELSGGSGVFMGEGTAPDLARVGYVQHEYAASGTATSYTAAGPLARDGRWTFTPDGTATYRTRVLVRRPADRAKMSGTVVVEWLNVSGGLDADPDWTSLSEEITRAGDTWVGVSAQYIGVEGGPTLVGVPVPAAAGLVGKGLKGIDPARYGTLEHPGDGFSFDIYTQVARAVRLGRAPTGGMKPTTVIAAGESQSAFALVTYYDGVQPLTRAFDGFFVHSRGSTPLPLVGPGQHADLASSVVSSRPVLFRTDLTEPVMDVQSESDVTGVLDSSSVRQPDSARYRLWEVAGTSHADVHLLGAIAATLDTPASGTPYCGKPINDGPMHIVVKAAFHHLVAWVRDGTPSPKAPRLDVSSGASPAVQRNSDGIALGGIRTPPVDVPVQVVSGAPGPNPALICLLLGSTTPLPASRLAQLYPSRAAYTQRYDADADKVIRAGFVLRADRQALLGFVHPDLIAG